MRCVAASFAAPMLPEVSLPRRSDAVALPRARTPSLRSGATAPCRLSPANINDDDEAKESVAAAAFSWPQQGATFQSAFASVRRCPQLTPPLYVCCRFRPGAFARGQRERHAAIFKCHVIDVLSELTPSAIRRNERYRLRFVRETRHRDVASADGECRPRSTPR